MTSASSPTPHEGTGTARDSARTRRLPLVLLVDDFEDARVMHAELLELEGFATAQAATGAEAIALATELLPDVVLMDLVLPGGMDGCEATRRLKADARTRAIPVVGLTGHVLAEIQPRARAAGWDVLLGKPCPPGDLVAEIRRAVALPR